MTVRYLEEWYFIDKKCSCRVRDPKEHLVGKLLCDYRRATVEIDRRIWGLEIAGNGVRDCSEVLYFNEFIRNDMNVGMTRHTTRPRLREISNSDPTR